MNANLKNIILFLGATGLIILGAMLISLRTKNAELQKVTIEQAALLKTLEAKLAASQSGGVTNVVALPSQSSTIETSPNSNTSDKGNSVSQPLPKTNYPPVLVTFLEPPSPTSGRRLAIANKSPQDLKFTITINRSKIYAPIIKGGGTVNGDFWLMGGLTSSDEVEISAEGYTPLEFHPPQEWTYGGKPLFDIEPSQ